ncbi:hypothetical protein [Brevibacillus nitrificans]|uniref:hypothetical protein n=1 Tax=Brevibacillus nitrificans TaxID=651560 RepID=UPI0028611306|nr:hypothetical protein [Brevibacillus nitrificans]MDR7313882.1 putative membrane protein YccC [Brevibacillus nitrificans]
MSQDRSIFSRDHFASLPIEKEPASVGQGDWRWHLLGNPRIAWIARGKSALRDARGDRQLYLFVRIQYSLRATCKKTVLCHARTRWRPSFWEVLGGSFDKNSIVFLTSVRFGLVLAVAAILAYSFELNRSYWVTLTCAVLLGCAIGLFGTLLIGRRQASALLPHYLAKTIRSQQQYLLTLFSEQKNHSDLRQSMERRKMQTNLSNLRIVYTTATGEIPSDKTKLEFLWPVIFSIEQIGYLLESCLKSAHCPILPDQTLSQLLLVFENMAKSAERQTSSAKKTIPPISGFPQLEREIREWQDALIMSTKA